MIVVGVHTTKGIMQEVDMIETGMIGIKTIVQGLERRRGHGKSGNTDEECDTDGVPLVR